ncbi:MAG: HigA family addiction module antitoxin [Candidatus Sumerlaeota bacterium]|nr:HigA family addiction module antitoxin [Candidatus Sumerlaeota bacterium]
MRMHNPPHPGEVLQGLWLEPMNVSIAEAARRLNVSRSTLSKILNGHSAISTEMAMRLEMVFGTSAESWLGHQASFDLYQMESKRKELAKNVRPYPIKKAA